MRMTCSIPVKFLISTKDFSTLKDLIQRSLLVNDFDTTKPIHTRYDAAGAVWIYEQDREDI